MPTKKIYKNVNERVRAYRQRKADEAERLQEEKIERAAFIRRQKRELAMLRHYEVWLRDIVIPGFVGTYRAKESIDRATDQLNEIRVKIAAIVTGMPDPLKM